MKPYVFKTRPHLVEKIWGGRKLETLFAKTLPPTGTWGEAWEVADLPEGQCVAANGPAAGETLRELVDLWGSDLIGTDAPADQFPLLVKLLDADADLSVQVHPGEDDLHKFEDAHSKDECWVILDVDEGGSILHGFEEGVTAESFREAVSEGHAVDLLRRVHVEPGDVVRVSPGTVHAICQGVALLEIQQPSDTTFRVYDYDRPGLDGTPRQLHLDEAMEVARFDADDLGREDTGADHEVLIDVDAYRIERLRPSGDVTWRVSPTSPQVVHALRGEVDLSGTRLTRGETAVVPAGAGTAKLEVADEETELILAGLGGHPVVDDV